jgi:GH25 family lysozyme M1 (1,4-beta-N-acetylmuramidase)
MTLNIVDVSSNNPMGHELIGDGVIVKATQGTGYINPQCDAQYQSAKKAGKLLGAYHYAGGGDPIAEADYFLANIAGYIHEAVLALDWEKIQNSAWGDSTWCRKFVDRVHAKTGVWCLIYVQASAINQVANLVADCGLWVAGYPDMVNTSFTPSSDFLWSTSPWSAYTLWQHTSAGRLDRSIGALDSAAWKKIANPSGSKSPSKPVATPKPVASAAYSIAGKTLETLAGDVIDGKLCDGNTRNAKLGNLATGVQAIVNHRLNAIDAGQAVAILKQQVLAGIYGDGDNRKWLLGTYYQPVQDLING